MAQSNDNNIQWDDDIQWDDSIEWDDSSPKASDNPIKNAIGGLEAVGGMVSGFPSFIYSGIEGLGRLVAQGGDPTGITERMHEIQDIRYHPKTDAGKLADQGIQELFSKGIEKGSPIIESMLPDALLSEAARTSISEGVATGALMNTPLLGLPKRTSPKKKINLDEVKKEPEIKATDKEPPLSPEELADKMMFDFSKKKKGTTVPQQRLMEEGVIDDVSGNYINPKLQAEYEATLKEVQPREFSQQELPFSTSVEEIAARRVQENQPELFGQENLDNLRKQQEIEQAYAQRDAQQKADAAETQRSLEYPDDSFIPGQSGINKGWRGRQSGAVDPKVVEEAIKKLGKLIPKKALPTIGNLDNKEVPLQNQKVVDVRIKAQDAIGNNDFKGAMKAVSELKTASEITPGSRFLGHIAEKILENDKISPESFLGKETGFGGSFNNETGRLGWNSKLITDLMHEAVHASVNKALIMFKEGKQHLLSTGQKIASRHIDEIHQKMISKKNDLIQEFIKKGYSVENAVNKVNNTISNIREFTAYSMTEPVLREWLLNTKYDGQRTFASKLSEAFRQMLGIEKKYSTEFDRFMWAAETLIKESDGKSTPTKGIDFANKSKQQKVGEAVSKIPGMKVKAQSYEFSKYDWKNRGDALEAIKTSPDFDSNPSVYTQHLASRGYLSAEILDNKGYHAGVSVIKGALDSFAHRSEQMLFGKEGLWTKMTRGESLFSPGKMTELSNQLIAAKGNADFQWKLDPYQTKIKDQFQAISKQLYQEVKDVLGPEKAAKLPEDLPNYFPGLFEGPWIFEVRSSEGGKPLIWTSNNKWVANLRAKKLAKDGYKVSSVKKRPAIESAGFGRDNMVAEYQLMIDAMLDADTTALRNQINATISADAMVEAGYHNRLKEWSNFKGNLGNNPFFSNNKNYYNAKEAMKRYIEGHNQWMAAQELSKFYKELSDLKTSAPMVRDYLQKYISDILGKDNPDIFVDHILELVEGVFGPSVKSQKQFVRGAASATTLQMLGASGRALSQNFFQPVMATIPKLLSLTKNPVDFMTPLSNGLVGFLQVLAKHQTGEILDFANTLTRSEAHLPDSLLGNKFTEKYKYALDTGIIDVTLLESTPPFKGKLANATWKYGTGLLTRASEQAARFATFSVFVDYLHQAGWPKELAYEQARQWTEGHMVDYSANSKPAILANTGALGDSLGRLQTYKANQFSLAFNYLKLAKRNKDLMPYASSQVIGWVLAGMYGIIGWDVLNNLINAYTSTSDDPDVREFSLMAYMQENFPEAVTWGLLSTATNKGFTNAFSQPLVGDGDFSNLVPVLTQQAEQGRALGLFAKDAVKGDLESIPSFEMGRRLSAVSPQLVQRQIHDKYLTNNGKAISKYTGLPTYTYKEDDKWLTNIMPFGRMKASSLKAEERAVTQRFEEGKSKQLDKLKALALDINVYGKSNKFKEKKFNDILNTYVVNYKGDPDTLVKQIEDLAITASLEDSLYKPLLNDIKTSSLPNVQRKLKYKKLIDKNE